MTFQRLMRGMVVLVATSGVVAGLARAADEKEVVGTWKLAFDPGDGEHKPTLTITKEAAGLVGKYVDGEGKYDVTEVKLKAGALHFTIETLRNGEKATASFEGKLNGDSIEGDATWETGGMSGDFPFTGKREAEKPKP